MKRSVALLVLPLLATSAAFAKPAPKTAAHATPHARITAAQATKAALRKYPGKVEGKVALENEEGKWEYAVNVRSGKTLREVMVNANTGRIASVEVTSAKEEANEAAAEKKAGLKKAGKAEQGEAGEAGETE